MLVAAVACGGGEDHAQPDAGIDAAAVDGPDVDAPDACVPMVERCDGVDENCDGRPDDPWQGQLGETCRVGLGACAATGTVVCAVDGLGTQCSAVAGDPAPSDTCGDDVDDDCDGDVDEGCACAPGVSRPCGLDTGACAPGTQTCSSAGQWGDCEGAIEPVAETCNDADDDCDGPRDENLTEACATEQLGPCGVGTRVCDAGAWGTCLALVAPVAESCNAVDDDCDGEVDDALIRGCGTDTGECVAGNQTCAGGEWGACTGEVEPAVEACDGRDEDCDGEVDDGCPTTVALVAPANGHYTGSVHATTVTVRPLRPTFRWRAAPLATRYELEVDDSCALPDYRACTLPSPEQIVATTAIQATLATNLAVSTVAPVGRTYFWRVRACNGALCGPWSDVRYLHVGRLRDDLDGDGYSEMVVGAARDDHAAEDAGRAYIYRGGAGDQLDETADLVIDGAAAADDFASTVALVGDLDGDGFGDLAIGAPFHDGAGHDAGRVYVYRGGPVLDATPDLTLDGAAGDRFGASVAAAGDVDIDGHDDLVVGAPFDAGDAPAGGRAYVYPGAAALGAPARITLTGAQTSDLLGWSVASAGDLDGDGAPDLVVGAPFDDGGGIDAGAAHVYRGGAALPATLSPDVTLTGVAEQDAFGWSVAAAGDVDGDGDGDLVVGAYLHDLARPNAGTAYVYHGGGGVPLDSTPDGALTGVGRWDDHFARAVATGGDHDGDGYADVVVGEPLSDTYAVFGGAAYVFRGGATAAFDPQPDQAFYGFGGFDDQVGWAVGAAGDLNGDGYSDVIVGASRADHDVRAPGNVYVYFGHPTTTAFELSGILRGASANDRFGGAVAMRAPPPGRLEGSAS